MNIYRKLYKAYGPRHWWPGETPFEVMVGAILPQNTSWKNVEKAIDRLKENGLLNSTKIRRLRRNQLASLIRSSGYYRIKAERLKAFVYFLFEHYDGNLNRMRKEEIKTLREKLLGVKGIGPETADSILLYGLKKPIFVVDAYTQRVLSRHGLISERASYEEVQKLFMDHLPLDERLFNEYHALLVHLGKNVCKKIPECDICPIKGIEHRAWRIAKRNSNHQIPRFK
ncbi:MAG: endonuclease III domain-containing protein [Deltaproteobacteria bacterium]|nr:endonuclease III domain-containing protein [Deltaproteobacteria bacterium]